MWLGVLLDINHLCYLAFLLSWHKRCCEVVEVPIIDGVLDEMRVAVTQS